MCKNYDNIIILYSFYYSTYYHSRGAISINKYFRRTFYILKIIFIIAIILLQLSLVIGLSFYAKKYLSYYYLVQYFLVLIYVLFINFQPIRVNYKISWIVFIALFPPEGIVLYTCYYLILRINFFTKKHNIIQDETVHLEGQNTELYDSIQDFDVKQQVDVIYRNSRYPVSKNTETTYLPVGEIYHKELLEELNKAEKYIFMQYYIVSKGEMLDDIMKVLIEKANNGVEVYLSYDTAGSLLCKPANFQDYCLANNIKVLPFNKHIATFYKFVSYRDHRKITVIDGVVAFTGGINIGDEYINKQLRFGHWKDMGVKLYGDGAKNFSMIFMKAWNLSAPNTFDYERYLNSATPHDVVSDDLVVSYDDGPFSNEDVAEKTYIRMISNAKKYVYITTPYFIPSFDILSALKMSAQSGVDVRIMTPGIPDKKMIYECTRSNYSDLISAGVRIFEYTPGFVHGKTLVSDDKVTFVGSVNLDFRSLIWNYECGAWVNSETFAKDVKNDTLAAMGVSREVTATDISNIPLHLKIFRSAINLFAPLL